MIGPHGPEDARGNGFRPRRVVGLLGLREHGLTPAADEVGGRAGLLGRCADAAADSGARRAGRRLGEAIVPRRTEAAGARLAQARAKGQTFAGPRPGPGTGAPKARPSPTCRATAPAWPRCRGMSRAGRS